MREHSFRNYDTDTMTRFINTHDWYWTSIKDKLVHHLAIRVIRFWLGIKYEQRHPLRLLYQQIMITLHW